MTCSPGRRLQNNEGRHNGAGAARHLWNATTATWKTVDAFHPQPRGSPPGRRGSRQAGSSTRHLGSSTPTLIDFKSDGRWSFISLQNRNPSRGNNGEREREKRIRRLLKWKVAQLTTLYLRFNGGSWEEIALFLPKSYNCHTSNPDWNILFLLTNVW